MSSKVYFIPASSAEDFEAVGKKAEKIFLRTGFQEKTDSGSLDKASVDLVLEAGKRDVLRESYDVDWTLQLQHAEEIGLGAASYELVFIG